MGDFTNEKKKIKSENERTNERTKKSYIDCEQDKKRASVK